MPTSAELNIHNNFNSHIKTSLIDHYLTTKIEKIGMKQDRFTFYIHIILTLLQ